MPNSYGLIVEGAYDAAVFEELIRRIANPQVRIVSRSCGGLPNLKKLYPALLEDLEHSLQGGPVAKALVVCDADNKNPIEVEQALQRRIQGRVFSFPDGVGFHAVRRAMETLLLADEEAINSVRRSRRGVGKDATGLRENPEDISGPKQRLTDMLSQAGLPYDAQVCAEIARAARLDVISRVCPYFNVLIRKIHDC
ncbi:MAG TPA: DUF4276 family protein [Terriglobales bacterium]|nr:DUF4276 family protein [Terriglobales bacterium]